MKKTPAIITLSLCVLGVLSGYTARKQSAGVAAPEMAETGRKMPAPNPRESLSGGKSKATPSPAIHSEETLESMIARGEGATYAGLALWMLDASEADIAAYWEFRKNGNLDGDMKRLLFLNWTRLDPQAAIAAVAGTKDASVPWWSWAAHDPQAALSSATPERLDDVARGIGEFQPEWLRAHFDEIPKEAQQDALNGLMTWKEDGDHVATLDFLKKHGVDFHVNLFKTLARKDPWAAFDWLEKNDQLKPGERAPANVLLETMKSEYPQDLERLAAMTPSGGLKWKIEDAIFECLLTTDPAAALAQAKAQADGAPLVAAKRLAQIGSSVLASDPEKAFGIAAEILAVCPQKLAPQKLIETGTTNTNWGNENSAAESFMEALLIKDPARTLDMTTTGPEPISRTFGELSGKWAEKDLAGYTEWTNRQTDPRIRNAAAGQVVNKLASQGHFQEAAEWAVSGETPDQGRVMNLAWQWSRANPTEASAWLEAVTLPENVKDGIRNLIRENP